MIRHWRSLRKRARSGTTLAEMVVSLLIFSILMASMTAVLHPAARIFVRMQKIQQAQAVLDTIIQELQGIALEASGNGYVKIYAQCRLNATNPNTTTDLTVDSVGNGRGADRGKALEFIDLDDHVLLVSADGFPKTDIYMGTTKVGEEESIIPGRLMVHYYTRYSGNTYLYKEEKPGSSVPDYPARAVTTVFADGSHQTGPDEPVSGHYMGNYVSVEFAYPEPYKTVTEADGTEHIYYSYLDVTVSLYDGPERRSEQLAAQDTAVLDFRYPIERLDQVTALEKTEAELP